MKVPNTKAFLVTIDRKLTGALESATCQFPNALGYGRFRRRYDNFIGKDVVTIIDHHGRERLQLQQKRKGKVTQIIAIANGNLSDIFGTANGLLNDFKKYLKQRGVLEQEISNTTSELITFGDAKKALKDWNGHSLT